MIEYAQLRRWKVRKFPAVPLAEVVPQVSTIRTGLGDSLVGTAICDLMIKMEPVTKARVRVTSLGAYTDAKTRDAEKHIRWVLVAAGVKPDSDHQLAVDVTFHSRTRQRRDLDNFLKLLLDACNGIAWNDDVQVTEINAVKKVLSPEPRIDLRIRRVGRATFDCAGCGNILSAKQVNERSVRTRTRGLFCSRKCRDDAVQTKIVIKCAICEKPFRRAPSHVGETCSHRCADALRKAKTDAKWRSEADGAGFPDLVLIRERIVYAELKARGGVQSGPQKDWESALLAAGAEVYCWEPSDWPEVERVLR